MCMCTDSQWATLSRTIAKLESFPATDDVDAACAHLRRLSSGSDTLRLGGFASMQLSCWYSTVLYTAAAAVESSEFGQ